MQSEPCLEPGPRLRARAGKFRKILKQIDLRLFSSRGNLPFSSKEVNENKFWVSKLQDPKCVSANIQYVSIKLRENNQLLKRKIRNCGAIKSLRCQGRAKIKSSPARLKQVDNSVKQKRRFDWPLEFRVSKLRYVISNIFWNVNVFLCGNISGESVMMFKTFRSWWKISGSWTVLVSCQIQSSSVR